MHWSDEIAREAIKEKGRSQNIATGISPSGPIHYGNFRELLTADLINESLKGFDTKTQLIFVVDDFDPLRKLYPFLDEEFEKHIGKPLSEIPDPEGCHKSYSRHYMNKFLESLPPLGIEPEVHWASELYKKGKYSKVILRALEEKEKIKKILEEITGRELPRNWIPFNPVCDNCDRVSKTKATDFEETRVYYECECGYQGTAKIDQGQGKLPWRIDWPARWTIFDVTIEPMGKDHAADGGSYDTGTRISKEIYNKEPPYPVTYEQIGLKGKGEMSSSQGIVLTPQKMLEFLPPSVIRYIITRKKPKRHIDLDTGFGIIQLIDKYQEAERVYYEKEEGDQVTKRTYELSQPNKPKEEIPPQIPFKHLVNSIQIAQHFEGVKNILARTNHWEPQYSEEWLKKWTKRAENWLNWFAPEKAKFQLKDKMPQEAKKLDNKQKKFLRKLARKLEKNTYTDEELHQEIYEIFKELDLGAREAFQSIYLTFLGRDSGPRAAWFLLSLDEKFVLSRLKEAAKENGE